MKRFNKTQIIGGVLFVAVLIALSMTSSKDHQTLRVSEDCVVITNTAIMVNTDETVSNDELRSLFEEALVLRADFYENQ